MVPSRALALVLASSAAVVLPAAAAPPGKAAPTVAPGSDLVALDAQLEALAQRVAPSVVQVLAYGFASSPKAPCSRGPAPRARA